MKVVVISPFYDINNVRTWYEPGQTVDFDDERAKELVKRGLVKPAQTKKNAEVE